LSILLSVLPVGGVKSISESRTPLEGASGGHNPQLGAAEARFSDAPTAGPDKTDKSLLPTAEETRDAEPAAPPPWRRKLTDQQRRQREFNAFYFREFRAGADTPDGPCPCGDRVFYKLAEYSPWRCRGCDMPNARVQVHRWFVALPARPQCRGAASECERTRHAASNQALAGT
jgi:hypothetical protein